MECPDDEILFALVEGELEGEALGTLDEHLDRCALCREVVAELTSGAETSGTRHRAGHARRERAGRFVLGEVIGAGAMGAVRAAHDPELDRQVAIKLLHAGGDGPRGRARLLREAQAMAKVTHPHVVTVHEVGTEDDAVFVAMELVEGTNLREWLAEPRSESEILEIFRQAGEGLAAAHDAGLVHRDFKSENVLVDGRGRARVGDFGLARGTDDAEARSELADDASILNATLTSTGALLGTPAYMAPEQLAGEAADARADQFAFAVSLWEALAGERPFSEATSIGALREALSGGPPAPPREIPKSVGVALRRALDPDPEARFENMRPLLAALAPPPARSARRTLVAVTAFSALAAAVFLSLLPEEVPPCAASEHALEDTWGPSARAELSELGPGALEAMDGWARRWLGSRVDACEATHVRHEQSEARLDARMGCLDRQLAAFEAVRGAFAADASSPVELLAALPDPDVCARIDGRVAPPSDDTRAAVNTIDVEIEQARVQLAGGDARGAREASEELVDRASTIGFPTTTARALLLRADALRAEGRYADGLEDAHAGLFAAEAAGDDRTSAEAWLTLMRVVGSAGQYADADGFAGFAHASIRRAGDPADLVEALLRMRGIARTHLGQFEAAGEDLRGALQSTRERLGSRSPRLAPIHTSLGNLARLSDRLDVALLEHERALALDRTTWGASHPRVGRDLHNVAGILRRLDRREEARERYLEALTIKREHLGEHPEVALTLNSLGLLAFDAGDRVEARQRWEAASAIFEAHGHGDAAIAHHNLALLELREERWSEAATQARAAIALDEEHLGSQAKRVGVQHMALGRALVGMGEPADARAAFERAREIGEAVADPPLVQEAVAELERLPPEAPARARRREAAASAPADGPAEVAPTEASRPVEPPAAQPPRRPTGSGVYGGGQAWD